MRRTTSASAASICRSPVANLPSGSNRTHHLVAKGVPTGQFAGLGAAAQAAMRLGCKVAEEERVHRVLEAYMQFADVTLREV
jgi:hypothetical protein